MLLLGFAFLAGLVTVLSPCVLPVLPVILSGTTGGRARPWGVVIGFVVTFAALTLSLSAVVQALGWNPDWLRWFAAGLILVFGLVLVVPAWKDGFLLWATRWTTRSNQPVRRSAGGFWSGLVLGFGLGVVWTPCVGPIMASVITLALSQTVDASSVAITLAYSIGTALPLLGVMFGGQSLLKRVPWLTSRAGAVQRGFGVLMLVTAVALFTGADRLFSTWLLTTFPSYGSGLTAIENQDSVRSELEKRRAALPVVPQVDPLTLGEGTWINSMPLTLAGLRGKVILVDFWTYSCVNCVRTLPYLKSWYETYRDDGLVVVGVHSPEFAFERSEGNLRQAMKDLGVSWPVVQDNAFGIWNAYQNQYWPAHYLYGRDGKLIESHFGEGHYAETEAAIVQALGTHRPAEAVQAIPVSDGPKTPETYLGYGRGSRFASLENPATDQNALYTLPAALPTDNWAFAGPWTIGKESSRSGAGSGLALKFRGARVYLVMGPAKQAVRVHVWLNGQRVGELTVDGNRMYPVVESAPAGGDLRLDFDGAVDVYAFTFG